jgi:replicative DNA helicase
MPCNIEAEQALLGALLYDNAAYERLIDKLQARHFFEPFHQRLFQVMEEHIRRGQLADPILLADRFKQDAAFAEFGGLRYLADLVDRAPPAVNAPDYARIIYDLALRRDLIRIGGEIASSAAVQADLHPCGDWRGVLRVRHLLQRPPWCGGDGGGGLQP